MRKAAESAVDAIKNAGIFSNPETLLKPGYMHLRRLASIAKNPKFQDPKWLQAVRELNDKHDWKLRFTEDGKLVLDEHLEATIMSLLQDKRAITLINQVMIDAEVSKPVVP